MNNNEEKLPKVNINYYPGHMAKTKKQIAEDLKMVDIVLELIDARIPISSQNKDIEEIIKNKRRIILLNKSDLASEIENKKWVKFFENKGIPAVLVNSNTGEGIKDVINKIEILTREEKQKQAEKGRTGKIIRAMVIGIPNVGKSSFINRISKKTSANVGNKPGVTKQKQWIHMGKIDLLDTPGVLWPKFEDEETGINLSITGTIKDELLPKEEIAFSLLTKLYKNHRELLFSRYKINQEIEGENEREKLINLREIIAKKRGAIRGRNDIDEQKISNILLEEFRSGKIGRITLETEK